MEQPNFLFLEPELILILASHLQAIHFHGALIHLGLGLADLLLEPLNLFPRQHFIIPHICPFLELGQLCIIALSDPLQVIFLSCQPYLVQSKQHLLNALFIESVVFDLHVQHEFVALGGRPN